MQAGEQEADPVARARTASSEGFRPVRTSSPHAAAATRRFLAVNASASRTAGAHCFCITPLNRSHVGNAHVLRSSFCFAAILPPAGVLHRTYPGLLGTGSLMHMSTCLSLDSMAVSRDKSAGANPRLAQSHAYPAAAADSGKSPHTNPSSVCRESQAGTLLLSHSAPLTASGVRRLGHPYTITVCALDGSLGAPMCLIWRHTGILCSDQCAVAQIAVTSRAETVAPMPLFTAGGQSVPVLSGNTSTFMGGQSAAAFHSSAGGQEGQVPEASLRPTSRPTPGKLTQILAI